MMRPLPTLSALLLTLCPWVEAPAASLWDAGLLLGGWRSELPRPGYGTVDDPLVFDAECRFPGVEFALCPGTPPGARPPSPIYRNSHWRDESVDPEGRFWVVGANAEPATDADCNSGPPNQSEAVGEPFEAVFGLRFGSPQDGRAPWRNEWLLAVDLSHRPAQLAQRPSCITRDYIPYLGIGMASERGSGGEPFATFTPGEAGPLLRLGARLVDSNAEVFAEGELPPPAPRGQHAGIWLESHWGGTRRWVWLTLFSSFEQAGEIYAAPWNWALRESVHAPGADIVVASLPALRLACPDGEWVGPSPAPGAWQEGRRHALELDVAALYACLADRFQQPPPVGEPLPLTAVHAWVEVGLRERDGLPGFAAGDFDSRLGMAFDGIDLLPPGPHALADARAFLIRLAARFAAEGEQAAAARIGRLDEGLERSAAIAELLRDPETAENSLLPLLLQRLILDTPSAGWLASHQARLANGSLSLEGVAHQLLRAGAAGEGVSMDRWVEAVQQRFLDLSGLGREAARQRSAWLVEPRKWQRMIAEGRTTPGALAEFLARHLLDTGRGRQEAEIGLLYHTLLGQFPDEGGLAFWRDQPDMPERLAEQLYYAEDVRRHWGVRP